MVIEIEAAIFPEVGRTAIQSQPHSNPLSEQRRPFNPRASKNLESEQAVPERAPFQSAKGDQSDNNANDLGDRLVLSESFRGQHDRPRSSEEAKSSDSEFAGDNDHNHPSGHPTHFDKGDESRAGEDFIRQRIH